MVTKPTILIICSDENFGGVMEKVLLDNGYQPIVVVDVMTAMSTVRRATPALVIVDRRQQSAYVLKRDTAMAGTPFIAVQPMGCEDDQCSEDFDEGMDAVVCKPGLRELLSRIRAILRREQARLIPQSRFIAGALTLDVDRHEVGVDGQLVEVTPKEFQILQQLIREPSKVFTRDELLNRVWGEGCALEEHTLDVHIHSLRQKLEADPTHPRFIVTVRGVGYKLRAQ